MPQAVNPFMTKPMLPQLDGGLPEERMPQAVDPFRPTPSWPAGDRLHKTTGLPDTGQIGPFLVGGRGGWGEGATFQFRRLKPKQPIP